MKVAVIFVMFLMCAVYLAVASECPMAKFYSELNCDPAPTNSTCPDYYVCLDRSDPTKCYYKGTAINVKESVPAPDIQNPCLKECSCDFSNGNGPAFNCARVDCFKDRDDRIEQESFCIKTYSLEECCSVGKVCGKDALAQLKTCTVDGETYMEGQQFYPDKRRSCICTAEWNGTLDDTYCREDIQCKLDLQYQSQISNNCGPMFKDSSCPIYFVCPTADSQVVKGPNSSGVNAQCRFGGLLLNVGDEVPVVSQGCTKCVCEVPPFVTCRVANDYGCGRKNLTKI